MFLKLYFTRKTPSDAIDESNFELKNDDDVMDRSISNIAAQLLDEEPSPVRLGAFLSYDYFLIILFTVLVKPVLRIRQR